MALTKTGKIAVKGTLLVIVAAAAGGLAYGEAWNAQNIAVIARRPLPVVTKTIVVTPTIAPTATPSARLRVPTNRPSATPKVTLKVTK